MDEELREALVNARNMAVAQGNYNAGALISYILGASHESISSAYANACYLVMLQLLEFKNRREAYVAELVNEALKDVEWT